MNIAILCSAHGFGHAGRQLALAEVLIAGGSAVTLFTAVPRALVDEYLPVPIVPWTLDVGIVQRDSVTEDLPATVTRLAELVTEAHVECLAAALRGFDVAVVDIASVALEAARRAGVPALAVGNFDWPWIYRQVPALDPFVPRLLGWQAGHRVAALAPVAGLCFEHIEPFGILARRRPAVRVADRGVLVSFGGLGLDGLDGCLPRIDGLTWILAPPSPRLDRPDVVYAEGIPFPALVAGADAVFTKPGYGIYGECALAGTPMVWLDRGSFPEAPTLEVVMAGRGDVKVTGEGVAAALALRFSRGRPPVADPGTAEALAGRVLRVPDSGRPGC